MSRGAALGAICAASAALAGCEGLWTPDYFGDRLGYLVGVAQLDPEARVIWHDVRLAWIVDGAPGPVSPEHTSVPESGPLVFPAGFELEVYARPPAAAMLDLGGGPRVALAYVVARLEINFPDSSPPPPDRIVGYADHIVIFAEEPVVDGPVATLVGGPLGAGLLVRKLEPIEPAPACAPAPCAAVRVVRTAPSEWDEALVQPQLKLDIKLPGHAVRPLLTGLAGLAGLAGAQ